jgi:YYY domain-containing protein
MLAVLSWWLIMEVLGLLALPLVLCLFRHLPERGYAFARPVGLLLAGYVLWMGASLGLLSNTRSAILFAMLVVGVLSFWIWQRQRESLRDFMQENRRVIVATEIIFALAFLGWAFVRAHNPDIAATEKPMEIAFLNAILRSEHFPPHDPWLSGFGISYYYFGYLLMAMLTKLSGVAASVAFNLAISLLFALTVTGAFSLVYNLIAIEKGEEVRGGLAGILWALLGPLFVAVIGNLEGLFEVLHTRGLGSPGFWRWLDVNGLMEAPVNGRWVPTDMWWWWRASRVVNDRDLNGVHQEVIDEFPQFSFLLGDMHPHVLALPFVLLALGLALNVLLGAREWAVGTGKDTSAAAENEASGIRALLSKASAALAGLWRDRSFDLFMLALCLGALGFLNTWDFPIHLLVVVAAYWVGQRLRRNRQWLMSVVVFAVSVAVPAVLLYLPFYLGFQSQAGGVLPLFFNVTRVHQYLLMFGPFVFVLLSLALQHIWRALAASSAGERREFWMDLANSLLWLLVAPLLVMTMAVVLVMGTAAGKAFLQGVLADERVAALIGSTGVAGLLRQAVMIRLANPWTFLLLALSLALLWYLIRQSWSESAEVPSPVGPATVFTYLIAGVAFLLTLVVEFVYLRDLFGTRMNTVFKFYYQAWVMMAIAAAFGSYCILGRRRLSVGRYVWLVGFAALVFAGMLYPLLAIPNKAGNFGGRNTLDGMAFLADVRPDDYAAIKWLQENVQGIAYIVESTGGSYSEAGFVSAFTGLPTILGWDFHQYQWRGNTIESGKRQPDIAQIYQSPDSREVLTLLDRYDTRYVYVGPVEKRRYELTTQEAERFGTFLEKVYEVGAVTIYRR